MTLQISDQQYRADNAPVPTAKFASAPPQNDIPFENALTEALQGVIVLERRLHFPTQCYNRLYLIRHKRNTYSEARSDLSFLLQPMLQRTSSTPSATACSWRFPDQGRYTAAKTHLCGTELYPRIPIRHRHTLTHLSTIDLRSEHNAPPGPTSFKRERCTP